MDMDTRFEINYDEGDYLVDREEIEELVLKLFAKRFGISIETAKEIYDNDWLDFDSLTEDEDFSNHIKEHYRQEYLAELRG